MAGRVNQVQLVSFSIAGLVKHGDRMRLDGDAALLFQVHRIEQLVLHLARGDGSGPMQQSVRKRRLPMVNMGDDAEISNVRRVHLLTCAGPATPGQVSTPEHGKIIRGIKVHHKSAHRNVLRFAPV